MFWITSAVIYLFIYPPPHRSVYDGQEHGLFMEKLEGRIRNHDREIEKMCNHHFQGFVDSITELLKVRGEAQKLKVSSRERTGEEKNRAKLKGLCSVKERCLILNNSFGC